MLISSQYFTGETINFGARIIVSNVTFVAVPAASPAENGVQVRPDLQSVIASAPPVSTSQARTSL